ncbi:TauD/TfdA family dioxygenase [Amorphoplanes nipponensis]|uniref:Protein AmbC n=1 Tax=Actinoplanes nipponensis TaxID=135950 RepID=A0A919JS13_9ACTN|nr:TauD/TfdA family dioxygenase [Actinoplanes nipponensis]GIE54417.1 protein AmbC [Actinoplanes nipponensis]
MTTLAASGEPGWLAAHRDEIRSRAATEGWVRIRGLPIAGRADAAAAIRALTDEPLTEREGFAPRTAHGDGVHSSSEWPPDQPMCMHHELSYRAEVPRQLVLACVTAPADGGATALADARAVLADLPAELVRRCAETGWRLLRSYTGVVGIGWPDAFGTTDRAAAEAYCATHGIEASWDADGTLRTTQRRPAVVRHPVTGQACWFNQLAFLNEWTMDPDVRDFLVGQFGPAGLPFTTAYGDGSPLDRDTVDHINEVYDKHTVREPWQRGDVLVLDNILTAHSREPYRGSREILVGMGEPVRVEPV